MEWRVGKRNSRKSQCSLASAGDRFAFGGKKDLQGGNQIDSNSNQGNRSVGLPIAVGGKHTGVVITIETNQFMVLRRWEGVMKASYHRD